MVAVVAVFISCWILLCAQDHITYDCNHDSCDIAGEIRTEVIHYSFPLPKPSVYRIGRLIHSFALVPPGTVGWEQKPSTSRQASFTHPPCPLI